MPYPSPADEDRNGGCGPLLLAVLVLLVVFGAVSCAHRASGAQTMEVHEARTDGPIYDLPQGVRKEIVCDSLNREYLLLTTEQGGVFLIPYLDEDGQQAVMPQAQRKRRGGRPSQDGPLSYPTSSMNARRTANTLRCSPNTPMVEVRRIELRSKASP